MFPGAGEAVVVAKTGTAVMQGLRTAKQPITWPNARESLLELYAILDDWCERSEITSRWVRFWLYEAEDKIDEAPYEGDGYIVPNRRRTNIPRRFASGVQSDIINILQKKPSMLQRWRASDRRQAARRSLRTILKVYCPELLDQFEKAVNARIDWINQNRQSFDNWFTDTTYTSREIDKMLNDMDATNVGLKTTLRALYEFITTNFPLSSNQDA